MNRFDYSHTPPELLNENILNAVSYLHEHKGRQQLFIQQKPQALNILCETAKVQSTDASNRIEGIQTTDKRLAELMADKTIPRNRAEQEIMGYRDVLALIHESYDYIDVKPGNILQLHRNLYAHTESAFAGRWKDSDNVIAEIDNQGHMRVRFRPIPAIAVPDAMDELCQKYNEAIRKERIDPLLLTAMFVFDFICIHPFNDGNGRMSRLLTLLLLYRSGYLVGKYISIEKQIERTKQSYNETLQASTPLWMEGKSNYLPFVEYLLGCLIRASKLFESRVEGIAYVSMTKPERVESLLSQSLGLVSKSDILEQCPNISATTVNRTLSSLLAQGKIEKVGGGRGTKYRWIG